MTQSVGETELGHTPEMVPQESGAEIRGRSLWQIALRRLRRDKAAMFGVGLVLFFVLLALLRPLLDLIAGVDPFTFDASSVTSAGLPIGPIGGISAHHWLGVEPSTGRDLMARLLYGVATSLIVSVVSAIVAVGVGVVTGIAAGYFGGWVDSLISRIVDVLLGFPQLLFLIALTPLIANRLNSFGIDSTSPFWRGLILVMVISVFGWPYFTRVIRGQVLSLREREFVDAARTVGASGGHILFRQILPNLWAPIIVFTSLIIPVYITVEASLAYLGVGFVTPTASLGVILQDAVSWSTVVPSYFFLPGLVLFLIVLGFNIFGDGLRDALDPRSSH
ncbi:ABC transporter permease [Fodinicola feengrottensis]|uniref:ABC transporter permease n=1 Tax=Fodinicola feengrottensis TaxID=435914 RepID=A0ABN2ISS1_9ACTN|nr:ABC transporter permease [Fodinicola feengrottensis]